MRLQTEPKKNIYLNTQKKVNEILNTRKVSKCQSKREKTTIEQSRLEKFLTLVYVNEVDLIHTLISFQRVHNTSILKNKVILKDLTLIRSKSGDRRS